MMTDDSMALQALTEKAPDADFLRETIGFAAERLMALEVDALVKAMGIAGISKRAPPRAKYRAFARKSTSK